MTPEELQAIKERYCAEHTPLTVVLTGDGMAMIENTEGYDVAHYLTTREADHFVDAVENIIPALIAEVERLQAQNEMMREALKVFSVLENYELWHDFVTGMTGMDWGGPDFGPNLYAQSILDKLETK